MLLIDKPCGPTSREVVSAVSRKLDLPSAGHCGTLDPLASGLLVVVSGCATRVQDLLTGHDKRYLAGVRLGAVSASDDREGPLRPTEPPPSPPAREEIDAALCAFLGPIMQVPPALSAIRQDGERLFKKVRRGEKVEPKARPVRIDELIVTSYDYPDLALDVRCGAGTYVRSLARDLGEALGTGAYLAALRRLRSGNFDVGDAATPDEIDAEAVLPLEVALRHQPRVEVAAGDLAYFLAGRELGRPPESEPCPDDAIAWCEGRVCGRVKALPGRRFRLRRLIRDPRS